MIPKETVACICLSVIVFDSVFSSGKHYYFPFCIQSLLVTGIQRLFHDHIKNDNINDNNNGILFSQFFIVFYVSCGLVWENNV